MGKTPYPAPLPFWISRPQFQPPPKKKGEALFRSQGMKHPLARIRMIDGFNEGWIDFEGGGAEHRTGRIPLEAVLHDLTVQDCA